MQPVKSYGLAETLEIIGKYNVLSTCFKWQEKTDPWSPAADHGIVRGTIENHWEDKVLAHELPIPFHS